MCAPSSNCSHQSAHNTTSFVYVLLFPRDSSFSSIVPAGTAHLSLTFPGTSYRATVTSSLPGRHYLSLTFPGTSYRATVTSSLPGRPTFHSFFPALRTGLLSHRPLRRRFLTSTKNRSTSLPTAGEAYHEYRQHSLSRWQSPRTGQSTLPGP